MIRLVEPPADAEARRRIQEDLEATLVVEAAAGTGKTSALVGRIVAVLRSGRGTLASTIAVTFTEKAAGEMKLRLRAELERVRTDPETSEVERERLRQSLAELETARIGTIHSLCADLLHERPIEARIDPLFEMAAQEQSEGLFAQAFDEWFERVLADPPEGVRRLLRRRPKGRDPKGPRDLLRESGWKLAQHPDFDAPWRRDAFDRVRDIDTAVEELARLVEWAGTVEDPEDYLGRNLLAVRRFVDELRHRESVRERDHDGIEVELRELMRERAWGWRGRGRMYRGLPRDEVAARRDSVRIQVQSLVERCDADLAACLHAELRPLVARYQDAKDRAGKLDFVDLLVRARDLVRDDRAVRAELQARFTHVFVDEFQDTDPLQAEILVLLAADDPAQSDWRAVRPEPGKLFVVGDPKQSIYRFRRADVALYEEVKRRLIAAGAELVHLNASFRGVPELYEAVNQAFAPRFEGGASQASYVPLQAVRPDRPGQPALVVLPVPRPYSDYGKITKWSIEASLPDAVGAFVDWLIRQSGWKVTERDRAGVDVPIEARHVCLLFRRFTGFDGDVTRSYVRALEARRVPHVLVGGRSFHEREEVLAVRNALTAIEHPDDELSVFATLRGPFFAIGDDALLAFRHVTRSLHPLRKIDEAALSEPLRLVARALGELARLHRTRNRRPFADTLEQLLGVTRAHAGVAIWPTGEQALANVLRVLDLARRFEADGATSFRAFVEKLEEEAERGDASEAPIVEEGTEGVRMMTVHRAKGLEFPVVILCDPTATRTREQPSHHADPQRRLWVEPLAHCAPIELVEARPEAMRRDEEEAVRLAYVAATRARDLLVVPAVGDERQENVWLDVLNPVIYPAAEARRRARLLPGLPAFGDDSTLERPPSVRVGKHVGVAPGEHVPEVGAHRVVWWDPRALVLDREHNVGLRQEKLLTADAQGVVSEEGMRAYEAWASQRQARIESGARPTVTARTVTELSHPPAAGASAPWVDAATLAAVPIERVVRAGARPHGPRFGALVHATLAIADLGADRDAVARVARVQARLLGASDEEIAAAIEAVTAAQSHPLLQRAAAAAGRGELRRETPLVLRLDDGTLAEGVVDVAFREDDGWTVIDFKTDVEVEASVPQYAAQVALYARAITAATGERARGVLLLV